MRGLLRQISSLAKEYPHGVLLIALLMIVVCAPMSGYFAATSPLLHGEVALTPLVVVLTLAAGFAIWPTAKKRATFIFLGGSVLLLLFLSAVIRHHSLTAVHLVGQVIFLSFVIRAITRVVFRAPVVDGNILCGAASIYLMIGVLAGFMYSLIDLMHPGSFTLLPPPGETISHDRVNAGWLIYFSFTTLTTVGFGDILPTSAPARSLAVLEAVVGQILLVVMMARLVGLHVAQVSSKDRPVVFQTSGTPVEPPKSRTP